MMKVMLDVWAWIQREAPWLPWIAGFFVIMAFLKPGYWRENWEAAGKLQERTRRRNQFQVDPRPRKCTNCGSIASRNRWRQKGGCPACGCDYGTIVEDPSYDHD